MKLINWTSLGLSATFLITNIILLTFDIYPHWMYNNGWGWPDHEFGRIFGLCISIVSLAVIFILAIMLWWKEYRGYCRRYVAQLRRR